MKYLVTAKVQFAIESGTRAAAHIDAVDLLVAADLPEFDLYGLDVVPDAPAPAGGQRYTADRDGWYDVGTNPPRYLGPDRPDFSSLDPTPLDTCTQGADCTVHPGASGGHRSDGTNWIITEQ